ncbi:MAG: ribonucleotide reductase N-terminal alpha domain-containing protein, partial [Natronomonas sp.]
MSNANPSADELTLPIKRTEGETLEDRMTGNAYHNILPARYLRKDSDGNLVESQEDLFERVAKNVALAEAVFEAKKRDVEVTVTPDQLKPGHPRRSDLAEEVFGAGTSLEDDVRTPLSVYNVNKFAYDTIVPELPAEIRDHVVEIKTEFQDLMERLAFTPNSPTLMNAGDELQQLSACFVDSPKDDLTDIHETAKEAAEVFQCLTSDARVSVDGKGIVSISEVEPGDDIVQRDGDGYRTRNVEEVHAYDDAPTKRLVTEGGISIRGTPNHRLLVDDEWKQLEDVESGDTVTIRLKWLSDEDETERLATVESGGQWADTRTVSNDEIANLHAKGLSDYKIADRLDCSASTVQRRRAYELDLPTNGSGGRLPGVSFDEDRFAALYEEGSSDSEIAAQLDLNPASIQQYRTAQNLESNGRPVKNVTQPQRLSVDLAELVGIWIGDGSLHQNGIRFHLSRDDVLNHVDTLSRRLFDTGIDYTWKQGCYEAVIHSHEIKRWWLQNFGDAKASSSEARVPDQIWQADYEQVYAFLRGLFSTDGTLTKGRYPRLYSASERLIDETLQLLLGVGIPSTKWEWETDERDYYSVAPTDSTGLATFADHVGYVDSRTEEMATSLSETPAGTTNCGVMVGDHTWKQEVEVVDDAEHATVYDVTVADNHEYVANAIVSHNSGGGMGYAFLKLRP